jgi:hypothetical protein
MGHDILDVLYAILPSNHPRQGAEQRPSELEKLGLALNWHE